MKQIDDQTDLQRYARRFMGIAAAERYAARFEEGGRRRIHARETRTIRRIFNALSPAATVLDLPCGTGRFLSALSAPGRAIVQADVSPAMLEVAAGRAQRLGLKTALVESDAAALTFPNGAFDVVFCNRLLHHIDARATRKMILLELRRVARAYVVLSYFDYHRLERWRRLWKRIQGRKLKPNTQPTLPEFVGELTEAGFEILCMVPVGASWRSQKFFILRIPEASAAPGIAID